MPKVLELQSERYSATGSISAKGVKNQLGRPHLDRFAVLIREALQKSWDAKAPRRELITFGVDLRELSADELRTLRRNVFAEQPPGWNGMATLSEHPWALLLYDRGTIGLGGPTRADVESEEGESRDFVDFVRNVGVPPDRTHSGGTYGFGKAALYLASKIGAIAFHTRTKYEGERVDRFMAAALLDPHVDRRVRYTGRHWWGIESSRVVEPAEGTAAQALAESLRFPGFSGTDLGTTICILSPDFEEQQPEAVLDLLRHAILSYCWPKLIDGLGGRPSIRFQIHFNGQSRPLPDVENYPPLNAFAAAYRLATGSSTGEAPMASKLSIECRRPARVTGTLALVRNPTGARTLPYHVERQAPFGEISHHTALVRAPHLVVKYLQGAPLPFAAMEYAGVFVVDDESDDVFAESEPPTHDEWVPDILSESGSKTLVRVTLRRISEAMAEFAGTGAAIRPRDDNQLPLGGLADSLGAIIAEQIGTGSSTPTEPDAPTPDRARNGKRTGRGARILVVNTQLDAVTDEIMYMHVDFRVTCPVGLSSLDLTAEARVVVEGGVPETEPPVGELVPAIVEWRNPQNKMIATGTRATIAADQNGIWRVTAQVPSNAVSEIRLAVA